MNNGEAEVGYLAEGSSAAVALIEHPRATPPRLVAAGTATLADEWIHPEGMLPVGALAAERVAASTS
jgi:hypothetical protein